MTNKKQSINVLEEAMQDLEEQRDLALMEMQHDFVDKTSPLCGDKKSFKFRYEQLHIKYNQLKKDLITHYTK